MGSNIHKIRNSFGAYDSYRLMRKNKWYNIGRPLGQHEYYTMIRAVNNVIAKFISDGKSVRLPCFMGEIEIRKKPAIIKFVDGKIRSNLPIDWKKTLDLWKEDNEAKQDKILIRHEIDYIYNITYNRNKAKFKNKMMYQLEFMRNIKQALAKNINEGKVDAVLKYRNYDK